MTDPYRWPAPADDPADEPDEPWAFCHPEPERDENHRRRLADLFDRQEDDGDPD